MAKNKKRLARELATLESFKPIFERFSELGIKYDKSFCDSLHSYVVHCWTRPEVKCNVFMKSLKFVPFGFLKGISGQGIENLKIFLDSFEYPKEEEKENLLSYRDKVFALKDVLLSIRDERNYDIVDKAIQEFCQ